MEGWMGGPLKAGQEAGGILYPVKGDRRFKVAAQGKNRWR
jgi:hypothetical protein